MYFKIPLDADLSRTSFRCYKEADGAVFIEYNEGFVGDNWEQISEEAAFAVAPEWFYPLSCADDENVTTEERLDAQMAYLVMKAKGSVSA